VKKMQGLGTIDNPYIVTTPEEYKSISNDPTACYKLGNDIDMSSSPGLACITFSGIFDGNGHRIIGQTGNLQSAFCRYLTGGAVVKNVGFALNLNNINGTSTGGVAAEVYGDCTIQKVWIEPATPGTTAYIKTTASYSYYTPYAGGIVGRITNGVVLIEDCYLADYVEVMATDLSTSAPYAPARAGGAVGSYENGTLTLRRFYKVRRVTAGGIYSTGRFDQILYKAGKTEPITSYNYYNRDYSNATSKYGERKTTSEMQSQATYITWDFVNTWRIDGGYPTLRFATPPKIESRTINSKIQFVFGRANINVTVSAKSIVQNLTGRITREQIGTRTVISKINPIFGRVTVVKGNQIKVTLKSTLNPLNGKVQTTATYSIDCFVDESTSGVHVLQTIPKEKIIETAIDEINQAILTITPHKTNRVVKSVINSIIGKANTIKEKTERLKSYVSPINTSARRYSYYNKVLRIVRSILKKIKTDIDIKIPGIGVKVKSDKIGTTDVNIGRIYDQVKVETTSPNVTVQTNQGQVDTKIKYQKVIIRIGDE
jgi:hypothetical protein